MRIFAVQTDLMYVMFQPHPETSTLQRFRKGAVTEASATTQESRVLALILLSNLPLAVPYLYGFLYFKTKTSGTVASHYIKYLHIITPRNISEAHFHN